MKQEDLQRLLDSLDEGPLGTRKDWQWESSVLRKDNSGYTNHLNSQESLNKRKNTINSEGYINRGGASRRIFSVKQVLDIKKRYKEDKSISASDLAKEYKTATATITFLLDGTNYKDPIYGPPVKVRKSPTHTCPHCKLSIESRLNYKKWHGDKCKKAPGYVEPEYKVKPYYPMWKELSTGFTGTSKQMQDTFPYINVPSMMNSDKTGLPIQKGKNKGLHFIKLVDKK